MSDEKQCFVPGCPVTSSNALTFKPNPKWFVPVPKELKRRMSWFASVKRLFIEGESNVRIFWCCNDHFNLDEDTETCVDSQGFFRSRLKYSVVPRRIVTLNIAEEDVPPAQQSGQNQSNVGPKPSEVPVQSTEIPNKEITPSKNNATPHTSKEISTARPATSAEKTAPTAGTSQQVAKKQTQPVRRNSVQRVESVKQPTSQIQQQKSPSAAMQQKKVVNPTQLNPQTSSLHQLLTNQPLNEPIPKLKSLGDQIQITQVQRQSAVNSKVPEVPKGKPTQQQPKAVAQLSKASEQQLPKKQPILTGVTITEVQAKSPSDNLQPKVVVTEAQEAPVNQPVQHQQLPDDHMELQEPKLEPVSVSFEELVEPANPLATSVLQFSPAPNQPLAQRAVEVLEQPPAQQQISENQLEEPLPKIEPIQVTVEDIPPSAEEQLTQQPQPAVEAPSQQQIPNNQKKSQLQMVNTSQISIAKVQVAPEKPVQHQVAPPVQKPAQSPNQISLKGALQSENVPIQHQLPQEASKSSVSETSNPVTLPSGTVRITRAISAANQLKDSVEKPLTRRMSQDSQAPVDQPLVSAEGLAAAQDEPGVVSSPMRRQGVLPTLPPQMFQNLTQDQQYDSFFAMSEEAEREKKLDELYASLVACIPDAASRPEISRNDLLDEAISYIEQMRAKAHIRKSERAYLAATAYQMKQKILELEMLKERLEKGDITMTKEEFNERFDVTEPQPLVRNASRRPKKRKKRVT